MMMNSRADLHVVTDLTAAERAALDVPPVEPGTVVWCLRESAGDAGRGTRAIFGDAGVPVGGPTFGFDPRSIGSLMSVERRRARAAAPRVVRNNRR